MATETKWFCCKCARFIDGVQECFDCGRQPRSMRVMPEIAVSTVMMSGSMAPDHRPEVDDRDLAAIVAARRPKAKGRPEAPKFEPRVILESALELIDGFLQAIGSLKSLLAKKEPTWD